MGGGHRHDVRRGEERERTSIGLTEGEDAEGLTLASLKNKRDYREYH